MHVDKSITIAASPSRVFAWLSPARVPRWDPSVVRMAGRDGTELEEGARFERIVRAQGHRFAMDAEATEVEENRRFAWRQIEGDFAEHSGSIDLEAIPGGTRVHLTAEVEYPYQMPLFVREEELKRELSHEMDEALFNLKRLVEARGAS